MIKIELDISQIKSEVAQIHSELHNTYNMTDTQRRDAVNRLVEKTRTLKDRLNSEQLIVNIK